MFENRIPLSPLTRALLKLGREAHGTTAREQYEAERVRKEKRRDTCCHRQGRKRCRMTTRPMLLPSPMLLIERVPIPLPNGRVVQGSLYRSPTRASGRRIIVTDRKAMLFDTDWQFDLGNARFKVETWLASLEANSKQGAA